MNHVEPLRRFIFLTLLCAAGLGPLWGCQQPPRLSPAEQALLARREACRLTAEAAAEARDPDKALRLLKKAIETDPAYIPARNDLATVYLDQGRLPEAAIELRLALSLDSQVPQVRFNMALVYERSGRYSAAADELLAARSMAPDDVEIQKALVRVWYRMRKMDGETVALIRSLLQRLDDPVWVKWLNDLLVAPASPPPESSAVAPVAEPPLPVAPEAPPPAMEPPSP